MSLTKILREYFSIDKADSFKRMEYFKYTISQSSLKWIESQISNHLIEPEKLTGNKNIKIISHGSEYIKLFYEDKFLMLRISTHEKDMNYGTAPHYLINGWNTNERKIKEHINKFIDYCITYFNAIEKRMRDMDLSQEEGKLFDKIESGGILFNDETPYPEFSEIHKKAIEKKSHRNRAININLP